MNSPLSIKLLPEFRIDGSLLSSDLLEVQCLAAIEIDKGGLVKVFVTSLNQIALCIQIDSLCLIELSDGGLAVLVFGLREHEGILAGVGGSLTAGIFGTGSKGIVISLLNLLIERLLDVVELEDLILAIYLGRTDAVARLEAAEDRNAEIQADVLREVVPQLGAERVGRHTVGLVVVGLKTGIEAERGIVTSLGDGNLAIGG